MYPLLIAALTKISNVSYAWLLYLFDIQIHKETNMTFMGFEGKPAGYFIIFCVCAVAYLVGWIIMKALVPKYKPVDA